MAKYDHGGGCSCGLYRECKCSKSLTSDFTEYHRMLEMEKKSERAEREAYHDRMKSEFPDLYKEKKKCNHPAFELCDYCQTNWERVMTDKPYVDHMNRPWGSWYVLDVDMGYKVKRLEILPDQSISLQYHVHRSEHWTIVQGEGKVIVDGNIFTVKKGESFHVPKMALHKITNTHLTETLIAIEVQMGEICSEDDIVRC